MKSKRNRQKRPVAVGVLGCSDIAQRKFIPALLQSEQAYFAILASRHPEAFTPYEPENPVPLMTYEELLDDPAVELVYISLPNQLHEEWSIRFLERGKHVLCEKPLSLSAASTRLMLDAADRNNRLLYENIMYLQHSQHKTVKAILQSGRIGRLLSLHSEFAFPGPTEGDFRLDPTMGGGAFHDMNRYPLSAALNFLVGKVHRFIDGTTETRNGLNISLQAQSITDAGEIFSFLTAFGLSYRSFYEITGERGKIRVERAYTTPADMENSIMLTVDGEERSFTALPCDHFLATIDHVCRLVRGGEWKLEHEKARLLAELAEMFQDNCSERER